jgi:hypothetical protein
MISSETGVPLRFLSLGIAIRPPPLVDQLGGAVDA